MSLIIDTIFLYLPNRRKATPSGWISFNAVCCQHNGTSRDTRQRGGIMINEGVSYHCFNCGFKASWQPGRKITQKLRKLMGWLNVPDDLITKCSLEALRIEQDSNYTSKHNLIPEFIDKALPLGATSITNFLDNTPEELLPTLEYLLNRNLYLEDYPFYWTPEDGFSNRLIIPFFYKNNIVGYTARLNREGKPKYISEQQPGYVFNLDKQTDDKKFVIVTEGPLDAISIDGVALLGSEISDTQAALINQLQREVIVLPDRDAAGSKMINRIIELGWSVSFPDWQHDIKDANDAIKHYGRLYTLYSVINSKVSNSLKIQLQAKKWFIKE